MAPTYDPTVFNVAGERQAKAIILTPEAGMTPEERWERETPDIIARIGAVLSLPAQYRVLDWGCGIGRIARPLCHDHDCSVVGVDLSADMRRLAVRYVGHEMFSAERPDYFETEDFLGRTFDAAVAIWSLQHIPKLRRACTAIYRNLNRNAPLFLLNRVERVIPVVGGWMPDGEDVPTALREAGFALEREERLGAPLYAEGSVWSVWRKAA